MLIDFSHTDEMTIPGMNGGTGTMACRMFNDERYRTIPTRIHPGSSIGEHVQESGDDLNYVLSGSGLAMCDGAEEPLSPGVMHICPQGSSHSIRNTLDSGRPRRTSAAYNKASTESDMATG